MADKVRTARIRTSDRSLFKRCRRKWGFQSHLRMNRDHVERPGYFWIGTGGHFALEDYHGHNYYGHPVEAFRAYVAAQRKWASKSRIELPHDWKEQAELGEGILDYYLMWGENRDLYETYWLDGEPQVEIRFEVEVPVPQSWLDASEFDRVVYVGTIDRVVRVEGELWLLDWKFYKNIQNTIYLDFDQQMSAYIWLGGTIYDEPIAGAILYQFKKDLPAAPKINTNGKLSTAKNQNTTHRLYRDTVKEIYGNPNKAPRDVIGCLNELAAQEGDDRDKFIRRDRTRRTLAQQESEGTKVVMEVGDMINPELALYPNPTKDCSWDCQMQDICLTMDRDEDWQVMMQEDTVSRSAEFEDWREYLPT